MPGETRQTSMGRRGRRGVLGAVHGDGEVLGHEAALDGLDAGRLEVEGVLVQGGVVVELGAVHEAARPGVDRGDRVGRRLLALLVLAEVARHRAVGSLGLDLDQRAGT